MNKVFKTFRGEGKNRDFRFNVEDPDKKPGMNCVMYSEGYTSKRNRNDGIVSVNENAPFDKNYERLVAVDGRYYFNLRAKNGEVISSSVLRATEDEREADIKFVKKYCRGKV